MQHTTEATKQYQGRHSFTDGGPCASPCLRQQEFCYYHHTTRRPVANPKQRRTRRSTFHLPLPEDRSAIQASIGEVLQRIAANEIDPRRAGLLLYGLQIASLNLPKPPAHRNAKPERVELVEEITTDPELGVIAPRTEISEKTERKSTVARLIESILQNDPLARPPERIPQNEHQPARTPEPATIPTLQATADKLHNPYERTKKALKKLRHPDAQRLLSTPTNQRRRHPDRSCSQHYREQRSGGTPAFRFCCCLFSINGLRESQHSSPTAILSQSMASVTKTTSAPSVAGATTALVLLTALNFVNYIDRYILPGVQEQIKVEFHLSDEHIGALTFWFMIAYMLTSPFTGWLGDRFPRKPMIIIAAIFWSGVNFFTASVHSYASLNLRHAALGIGEASFGIFAPAVLSDFYPEDQRNRVLTIFNIALFVGAALGYIIGGTVGEHYGWRRSFIVSAIPGTIIAILIAFLMKEPARGASQHEKAKLEKGTVSSLIRNKAYLSSILGYAAVTFSLGGISWWMPSFLQRIDGRSQSSAAYLMGIITLVAGLGGTVTGGFIAQRWSRTNSKALYLVPGISAATAVPPALLCFFGPHSLTLAGLALAVFLISLGTGPVNAATLNAVRPEIRATAMAGQLFIIHALGDMISPRIIGAVSDRSTLNLGLGSTLVTMLLAAIIFFNGARYAPPLHTSLVQPAST